MVAIHKNDGFRLNNVSKSLAAGFPRPPERERETSQECPPMLLMRVDTTDVGLGA